MKQWMAAAVLTAMVAAPAARAGGADDTSLTGVWKITGEVSGVPVEDTCTLKHADTSLTGVCETLGAKWDTTGKVDGKTVTFVHKGTYEGGEITMTYTGKLSADGASMTGTLDVDPYAVTGSFAAKKDAPAPPPAAGLQ